MASAVYTDLDFRKACAAVSVSQAFSHPPSQSPLTLITSPRVPATPVNTPSSNMSTAPSSPPFVPTDPAIPEVPSPISGPASPFQVPNNTPASVMSPILETPADSPLVQATVPPNSPDAEPFDSIGEIKSHDFANLEDRLGALSLRRRALSQATTAKAPQAPNDLYEVKFVPGRGYGCFARQPLKCGTRILEDSPLMFVKQAYYYLADVMVEYEKLSIEDKRVFWSLHSAHGQDPSNWPSKIHSSVEGHESKKIEEEHKARIAKEPTVLSIFQTNCMEKDGGSAIFPNAARFNHSCNPNATFTWNPAIEKETVHVIRDVEPGEEITIAYCSVTHSKTLRRWELKHYGFFCDCPACGDDSDPESFAAKSAARRLRLHELEESVRPVLRGHLVGNNDLELIPKLLEIIKLRREEGFFTAALATAYYDLACLCADKGDLPFAKKCTEKALRVRLDCSGPDFPLIQQYRDALKQIEEKMSKAGEGADDDE